MIGTHFILKWVPLESRVFEYVMSERESHFAQKGIASEVIVVPDSEPEVASVYLTDRQAELQNFIKNRIQGVFLDSGFAFA